MSNPNEQHVGEPYASERNTVRGKKYLKMSAKEQKHFWYFFLLYCQETGQEPHALLVHEDGYRSMALDTTGKRHRFHQRLHSKIALRGRNRLGISSEENFWTKGRTDNTKLLEGAVDDALLDVFQPAIEAGREASECDIKITEDDWGNVLTAARPAGVSRRYPATVSITPMPPPELAHLSLEEARQHVKDAVAAERKRTRVARVPKSRTPRPRRARRNTGRHAGRADLVAAADEAYRQFTGEHYAARIDFRDGRRDAVFPAGTVFWREIVGVNVAPQRRAEQA